MMTTQTSGKPYVEIAEHRPRRGEPVRLRVPWVAQWSGEQRSDPMRPVPLGGMVVVIQYADETLEDRVRDVLWMRTNVDRSGEPQFSQLNVYRQRDAMIHQLCQVCGQPAGDSWLIPPTERVRSGPVQTAMPPTCEDCIPVAQRQCPALNGPKGPAVALTVRNYRLIAVYGDIVEMRNGRIAHHQGEFRLTDPRSLTNILARQFVVEIYDYRRRRQTTP